MTTIAETATALDRAERATTRTTDAGDTDIATHPAETRVRDSGEPAPLYCVEDRRCSGEWRTIAETNDVHEARRIALLIRWAGGEARVELIPRPLIP